MKNIEIMINFIENEINENNKFCNAIACDGDFHDELVVKIKTLDGKKQKDVYKRIIEKALSIGGIIKNTCPGNLVTTLKF